MTIPLRAALPLTWRVLGGLRYLNIVYGLGILALLAASVVAREFVLTGLGVPPGPGRGRVATGMRLIMLVGIASVPIAHVILTRLRAIVGTVRDGDPFVAPNARRLEEIAWAVLGLELLHLAVGAIGAGFGTEATPLDLGWSFSLTPWVAVLLLFVLARVFEEGARMRADLEGTV